MVNSTAHGNGTLLLFMFKTTGKNGEGVQWLPPEPEAGQTDRQTDMQTDRRTTIFKSHFFYRRDGHRVTPEKERLGRN